MPKPQTAFYDSITAAARGNGRGIRYLTPPPARSALENFGQLASTAPWTGAVGSAATAAATRLSGPVSSLLAMLRSRAQEQLAMGGDLGTDEIRAATQGARAAGQARGIGGGQGGIMQEVLARALASSARRRERETFATGVAGLEQQQQGLDQQGLQSATAAALAPLAMQEGIRQFDIERADTLTTGENNWNWNAMTGGASIAAARKAGQQSLIGSLGGSLLKAL